MSSLAVKLPINKDSINGYQMIDNFEDLIKQNLKMLVLTAPGERVMEPNYGAGLRAFLFENFNNQTFTQIDNKIRSQVLKYMPLVQIVNISFEGSDMDRNLLGLQIFYAVPDIGFTDLLEFTI
jgi:phage baseplate assembly protein W|tara:strand:- start:308 stop:676 length:369 start_codon:yes stop_codon:yes gene_type:complete